MIKIIQIVNGADAIWGLADNGSLWSYDGTWKLHSEGLPPADPVEPGEPSEDPSDKEKLALNITFK